MINNILHSIKIVYTKLRCVKSYNILYNEYKKKFNVYKIYFNQNGPYYEYNKILNDYELYIQVYKRFINLFDKKYLYRNSDIDKIDIPKFGVYIYPTYPVLNI